MKRSYNQYCATARALDVIGGRWTLLLVRELITGPKRYKDLLEALPGMGTNLLADRLRDLAEAGVLQRATLPPPAGSAVYELTPRGRALEPVIMAIARWGIGLLGELRDGELFRPSWAVLAMRATFRPDAAVGVRTTCEFHVDDDVFHVRVADGAVDTREGPASDPDVAVTMSADTLLALAAQRLTPADAVHVGAITLDGELANFERLLALFAFEDPLPA